MVGCRLLSARCDACRLLELEGSVVKGGFGAAEKAEYEARLDTLLQASPEP